MVGTHEDATSPESELPGFIEHLPAAARVLRRSSEDLLEFFWDERYRNRACEQAFALSQAAKLQGLIRIFTLSRALASLLFLSQDEALPLRHEMTLKVRELVRLLEKACSETAEEATG
jgi:hypothetical protein